VIENYINRPKKATVKTENKMDGGHVGFLSVFERSLFYTNF